MTGTKNPRAYWRQVNAAGTSDGPSRMTRTPRQQATPLSPAAKHARQPLPPASLVGAFGDRPHTESGRWRVPRLAPRPCGCTTAHRCPEAVRLRQIHTTAWEAHDTPAIVEAREAYGAHMRHARVTPGTARWEEAP